VSAPDPAQAWREWREAPEPAWSEWREAIEKAGDDLAAAFEAERERATGWEQIAGVRGDEVRQRDERIAALTAERDALSREVEQWRDS
jgi:hypothetical protein